MPDTNLPFDPTRMKFGIGQPVPRQEDPTLLRGEGRYTDDLALPGQAHAWVVRSPHAHGILRGLDAAAAREAPGVLLVLTAADLAGYGEMVCAMPFEGLRTTRRPALAADRVRWVGDPVAVVIAETRNEARDAAELVVLDVDPLPAVTEASEAASATPLYDDIPGNCVLDFAYGDPAALDAAFARAAHVQRLSLRNNRVVVAAMEPRAALAEFAGGRWTLHVGCQGVFGLRNQLAADVLRVPREQVRVLTGNVGGSFGMKASAYPEYLPLLHAAKALGRPVKWADDRSGAFLSDQHGRDHEVEAELALDAEGRMLAVRLRSFANMGAYLGTVAPNMATGNFTKNIQSNYAVPLIGVFTRCMLTNTTPVSAYRGAGRPESNYFMERLIEAAAAATGREANAIRRLNHITEFPYKAASGSTYDSGEFGAVLDEALAAADVAGFPARRAASEARGMRRGLGVGNFLECTAPPQREQGGLRFGEDGTVTVVTGTLDYGQGHWTPFAQVLHARLGVPFESIRLLQGDSDQLVAGGGTGGSKSLMASGAAIAEASEQVIEKGKAAAAHVLEAAAVDIEFRDGRFGIAGTDRSIAVLDLAARLRESDGLPPDIPSSLDVTHVFEQAPMAFPNGCHVCEVEVDPETGAVAVDRYVAVNDFGVVVNPLLVAGQAHGGIAQGIGQAILERVAYTEDGQPITGTFMDYGIPRADNLPAITTLSHDVPCKTNPLGVKGCGEAGCAGSLPAVMNAVCDAIGVEHIDMPATPERVWAALRAGAVA